MSLAWHDIRHNLGRFLLTCVGLGLLLGVVLSMIGIYRGLVEDALALVRGLGADIWVVEADTRGPFAESSRIPGDSRDAVARIRGVTAAGAITLQTVETLHGGRPLRLQLVGYQLGRPGGPATIAVGRAIARARFELVADASSGLQPGELLRLGRDAYRIVGLTHGQVASGGDPVAFLTLRDAQVLQFELAPASARRERARGADPAATSTVNAVVARVSANLDPAAIADDIRRWKHLQAITQAEQELLLTSSVVDRARKQIGLFTVVLMTVSTVIIALIIYTMTMDKVRAIATLKLIGAPDRTIVGLIVQQALALGLIALALGTALIASVKDWFPRRVILSPEDAVALAGVVLVVCVVASGLGVRLALRIDPATALGS